MFMMVDVQIEEETTNMDMDIELSEEAILEILFHALAGTAHL
jgi:hypothetical protein